MPQLRTANLVVCLLVAALFAMWFFLSLYLQQVLGYERAARPGLAFLPMTLAIVAASTLAPRLVGALRRPPVLTAGMSLAAAGLAAADDDRTRLRLRRPVVLAGGVITARRPRASLVPATIAAVQGVARLGERARLGHGQHVPAGRRCPRPRCAHTLATTHSNAEVAWARRRSSPRPTATRSPSSPGPGSAPSARSRRA